VTVKNFLLSFMCILMRLKSFAEIRNDRNNDKVGRQNLVTRERTRNPAAARSHRHAISDPFGSLRRLVHKSRGFTIPVKKGNAIFIVISCSYI